MFKLTSLPLERINIKEGFTADSAGAFATFEGRVRDHSDGKKVLRLEYEAEETLCTKEAEEIFREAKEKFSTIELRCYHRLGIIEVGQMAVWVGCLAAHRDEAFKACRYIIDEIKKRLPIWKKEYYAGGDSGWVGCKSTEYGKQVTGNSTPLPVTGYRLPEESDYYARQINLPEVGAEGQKKLKEAKVLIVGVGGLGCPALMSLSGAGVGTIGICEHDKVELSNLHRQFLYGFDDIGRPKVQVAKEKINSLNPSVTINAHQEHLNLENAQRLIENYDIVLDCTDDIKTKYLLNDACFLNRKTLIQAGIFQWEGQLRVMLPSQKGCLRCLWPSVPTPGCVGTCVDGGVLGVIPNIFGHLQAMEAIRIILNMQKVFENELLILNVADFHIRRLKIKPESRCPLCGKDAVITQISKEHYEPLAEFLIDCHALNADLLKSFTLVDVREAEERADSPLMEIKSEHVPLSRVTGDTSPFAKNKKYLLFCSMGVRSSQLAQMLREEGYENIFAIKDGIEALRHRFKETVK